MVIIGIIALLMGIGHIVLFFLETRPFRRWMYLIGGILWLIGAIALFYFNFLEINTLQNSLHTKY